MKKKVVAIALIVLFVVDAVAFASTASVRHTSTAVFVSNTGNGEVCVVYEDDTKRRHETNITFYDVTRREQSRSFAGIGTVVGAFSTYCEVEIPE